MKIALKGLDPSLESLWILNLRWIAALALFATPSVVKAFFEIEVAYAMIYAVAAAIVIYNSFFSFVYFLHGKKGVKPLPFKSRLMDNMQIAFDLVCLSALIHFSGGVENPFIFYFIFHVIISGIILRGTDAFFQTTGAVIMFLVIASGEHYGIISHHVVAGFPGSGLYLNGVYVAGVSVVFISTLYISLYMAASISKGLKEREVRLIAANRLLEEKDRIKSEYVLRVSHDIKGHIAAIQSSIQPVMGGYAGELNAKQKNLLERAEARTEKLMQFVKMLLNLTILKLKNPAETEAFSVPACIENAVSFVSSAARIKNIKIKRAAFGAVREVKGVISEIQATLVELLTNAVRYSPQGSEVSVNEKYSAEIVVIEVKDSGIGIGAADIARIFDEFFRAQNAKEMDPTSSGLGLAMAKTVVEKHGGKIEAESEQGNGTLIRIILPAAGIILPE
jgi:signal transduction histidine kinase